MQRKRTETAPEPDVIPVAVSEPPIDDAPEMDAVVGRVKWFDATRGFGFVVSDALDGDILVHFSVLREHGRRSLPEGLVRVPAVLPDHQAFIVRKWDEAARKKLREQS